VPSQTPIEVCRFETFRPVDVGRVVAAAAEAVADWPTTDRRRVELVTEEVAVNIAVHGYADREPGPMTLAVDRTPTGAWFEFADEAPEYNPTATPPRRPDLAPGTLPEPGGVGLVLIATFADGLHYRREGRRNLLVAFFERRAFMQEEDRRDGH
jgi:anti-sigma regulatory factor (Ser/Thr protein kinase)